MESKISFIVLRHTGSQIRQLTVSKGFLLSIKLFSAVFLILFGFLVYDYINLKIKRIHLREFEGQVLLQRDQLESDTKQIQLLAKEINTLKSKLIDLNRLEQKIKLVVGLEESGDADHIFGIGGSAPEDIDPKINLTHKKNSLFREMHDQVNQLQYATGRQAEEYESFLQYLEEQRNFLASTPAIRPVKGWISSVFGYRKSPITGLRDFHKGLDIAAPRGTPIVAPANGVVTFVGRKGAMGKMIVIDHGHGMVTRYGHVKKSLKKKGDTLKRGDVIALVGRSGRTTGSHVHYEVLLNGINVNPKKYILN